jgi:hypothetical protein
MAKPLVCVHVREMKNLNDQKQRGGELVINLKSNWKIMHQQTVEQNLKNYKNSAEENA